MRIEQLEYLVALKKYGSMSVASEKLHVTQQTLSIAMKKLEEELESTLLTRTTKGVLLTAIGELVYEKATRLLFYHDEIKNLCLTDNINRYSDTLSGTIKLAATQATLQNFLGECISRIYKRNPKLNIICDGYSHSELIKQMNHGNYELGFMNIGHDYLTNVRESLFADYTIETLTSGKLSLLVHRHSDLANQKSVSLKRIAREYTIACANIDHLLFLNIDALFLSPTTPASIMQCSNINVVFDSIIDNNCVVLSSCNAWHLMKYYRKDDIIQLPLRENVPVETIAIIPKKQPPSQGAQLFLDILRKVAQVVD